MQHLVSHKGQISKIHESLIASQVSLSLCMEKEKFLESQMEKIDSDIQKFEKIIKAKEEEIAYIQANLEDQMTEAISSYTKANLEILEKSSSTSSLADSQKACEILQVYIQEAHAFIHKKNCVVCGKVIENCKFCN